MPNSVARLAAVTKSLTNAEERIMHGHPNYLQFEEPKFDLKDVTVEELASAANVSVDTIKHAIYVREQQMKAEHRAMLAAKLRQEFVRTSTTARTTTTTTPAPLAVPAMKAPVMNWAQPQNELENVAFESKMSKVSKTDAGGTVIVVIVKYRTLNFVQTETFLKGFIGVLVTISRYLLFQKILESPWLK